MESHLPRVAGLIERGVRMGTSYGGMIRAVALVDVTADDMEIAAQHWRSRVGPLNESK
jgi:hypothetical protein